MTESKHEPSIINSATVHADNFKISILYCTLTFSSLFMAAPRLMLLLLLILTSCTTQNAKSKTDLPQTVVDSSSTFKNKQVTVYNFDTLVIDKKAAIFYSPDTTQIAKRKKEVGEDNFYIGADDYLNYMQTSHDYLDSVKLPILDAKDKKYLKFIRLYKTQNVIKLDTLSELWDIYLFDPNKKEKLVNMTIIDEEYKNYFN